MGEFSKGQDPAKSKQEELAGAQGNPQGGHAPKKEVEEKQQRQQGDRDLGEDSHAQTDSQGMK